MTGAPTPAVVVPDEVDPIRTEVIKNELSAICEEMAIAVSRTARSPMVRSGDFAASISDAQGCLIGQGYAAPIQVAHFLDVVGEVRKRYGSELRTGDAFITNDPYGGMGHLPDLAVIVPVLWSGELVGFTHAYSHHTDIGGRFPGGMTSKPEETYEEGLRIPAVRLFAEGRRNEALAGVIASNVRAPEVWFGDLNAKVAGCRRGTEQLCRLLDVHGLAAYRSCCEYLIDTSERETREAIAMVPDGRYGHSEPYLDEGTTEPPPTVSAEIVVDDRRLTVNFAGTGPQARSAVNLPFSSTKATVYAALRVLIEPESLMNSGFVKPITVTAPPGTLVNPTFPAAVGGRGPLMNLVLDVVLRALAKAVPEKVPIPGEAGYLLHFASADGKHVALDAFFGGWGGRPEQDGIDGVAPLVFGSYGTSSVEVLERETGVVVTGFGFVPDSEGAGRQRGSLGIYRSWRFTEAGSAMVRRGRLNLSRGLSGGQPGAGAECYFQRGDLRISLPNQTHFHVDVQPGDQICLQSAGAGGYGDPHERDPAAVQADVTEEKVSRARARSQYGVAIRAGTARRTSRISSRSR